jgi:pimeloyl-ACP methyl ester carboxylesterase
MDVVLLHSGVTDSGEWDAIRPLLEAEGHRVLAPDLPGFGSQPEPKGEFSLGEFVLGLPFDRAALVGTSNGGRAALEATMEAPGRVERLVVIGSNPFGWSEDVAAVGSREEELWEAGRLDDAAELMVRAWVDGPHRGPDVVPQALRTRVLEMQKRAYELQGEEATIRRVEIDPSAIRVPMLFIRGALDWDDIARAAQRFAAETPDMREVVVDGAAHLPTMEQPETVAAAITTHLGSSTTVLSRE